MKLDRLRAEALAWPLVDLAAFRQGAVELTPSSLLPGFSTRAAELGQAHHAEALAHHTWRATTCIATHLVDHAVCRLERWGHGMRLRADKQDPGREILAWRGLSMALPPMLLVAAATPRGVRPVSEVALLDAALAPQGQVAHLHLHAGAVYPFEVLWARLAARLDLRSIDEDKGERPFGAEWAHWLVRAMLARRCLAHRWGVGIAGVPWRNEPQEVRTRIDHAIEALRNGRLERPPAPKPHRDFDERCLARVATQVPRHHRKIRRLEDVWRQDPLFDGGEWPEGRLLQEGLERRDGLAHKLFLQYLRIKTALFRHMVSDAAKPGLSPFVTTYAHIRCYSSGLEQVGLDLACRDPALRLGAVELRTSPPDKVADVLNLVSRVDPRPESPDAAPAPTEWGWVLHFLRAKGSLTGVPTGRMHAGELLRKRFREHQARAEPTARALQAWPRLLHLIRGLDIAGQEPEGPLWLCVPALHRLLVVSRQIARESGDKRLTPLRITLHAGEDYRHLLTGLRAIGEILDWGLLSPGDRLGHALALGELPTRWSERHRRVAQPRWERLQDLVWAHDACCGLGALPAFDLPGSTLSRWEREAADLSQRIWGRAVSMKDLSLLRTSLGRPRFLPDLGITAPAPPATTAGSPGDLMCRIFYQAATARLAFGDLVEVETAPDATVIEGLQIRLRRHLGRQRIAVELNPSSNLVIGGMDSPVDQPMFQIRPLQAREDDLVAVTISADDPISFSTRLSDEFAYAWAGLVVAARSSPLYARTWLDDAAENSWRYRFTSRVSCELDQLAVPGSVPRRWRSISDSVKAK